MTLWQAMFGRRRRGENLYQAGTGLWPVIVVLIMLAAPVTLLIFLSAHWS